jgi:hypothetical protein
MFTLLSRILVGVAILSLVFPPGWCCVLLQAAPAEEQTLPGNTHRCPCSPVPAKPVAPAPEHGPRPGPDAPLPACCCQPPSATLSQTETASPDLSVITADVPAQTDALFAGHAVCAHIETAIPSPPLQILHCVWRC